MALIASDYLAHLQALLPQGPAWPQDAEASLTRQLSAWADELTRIDSRVSSLFEESDPRTAAELFTDWERVAGLPDACIDALGIPQTTAQRRAALVAKIVSTGGQSQDYYVSVAAGLGYAITITEFDPHDVNDDVNAPILGQPWRFAWQVGAAGDTVGVFTVSDTVADPLAWWGNDLLECVITRLRPAHTHVLFAYS